MPGISRFVSCVWIQLAWIYQRSQQGTGSIFHQLEIKWIRSRTDGLDFTEIVTHQPLWPFRGFRKTLEIDTSQDVNKCLGCVTSLHHFRSGFADWSFQMAETDFEAIFVRFQRGIVRLRFQPRSEYLLSLARSAHASCSIGVSVDPVYALLLPSKYINLLLAVCVMKLVQVTSLLEELSVLRLYPLPPDLRRFWIHYWEARSYVTPVVTVPNMACEFCSKSFPASEACGQNLTWPSCTTVAHRSCWLQHKLGPFSNPKDRTGVQVMVLLRIQADADLPLVQPGMDFMI